MTDHLIIVVDDNDRLIGYKPRSGLMKSERNRIAAIWIENSKGEVLLAQRHRTKKVQPLSWGPSAVGNLEKGETYVQNAYKELAEELGVTGIKLQKFIKNLYETSEGKRACMWYKLTLDWPIEKFTLQEDEVEQVKWVDKTWLVRDLQENPGNYTPSAQIWPALFQLKI